MVEFFFTNRQYWKRVGADLLSYIDKNHYYRFHFIYFVMVGFVGGIFLFIIEAPTSHSKFIDCMFASYSSMTSTGLLTVDIQSWTIVSQAILMILMQLGSTVMLTLAVVLIRRYYMRRAYSNRHGHYSMNLEEATRIQQQEQELHTRMSGADTNSNHSDTDINIKENQSPPPTESTQQSLPAIIVTSTGSTENTQNSLLSAGSAQVTLRENVINSNLKRNASLNITDTNTNSHDSDNAQIHHFDSHDMSLISEDEKDKSREDEEYLSPDSLFILEMNIEYRSLGKLLYIIPIYQITIYIIGFIVLSVAASTGNVNTIIKSNQVNSWWWGLFNTVSAFNNVGITLLNDNMIQLNRSAFILFMVSILILLGNTMFPVVLRLIIYILRKISKDPEPYEHLLHNPRSVYTHLFPYKPTMILLGVGFIFTFSQVCLMAILEANEKAFEGMSSGDTFVNYLFHSVSTRTGGFNSIDISLLSNSVLLLFVGLMFVSSYPFVISLKGSAVNGKYSQEEKTREVMKDLLIRDIFILYICILLIGIFEETRLDIENNSFTVFHVMFEVVSAFGTVGLTMGNPNIKSSFSTLLGKTSKLIIIIVMLLGKHRSLPDSVDSVVAIEDKDILSKFLRRKYRQYNYN